MPLPSHTQRGHLCAGTEPPRSGSTRVLVAEAPTGGSTRNRKISAGKDSIPLPQWKLLPLEKRKAEGSSLLANLLKHGVFLLNSKGPHAPVFFRDFPS